MVWNAGEGIDLNPADVFDAVGEEVCLTAIYGWESRSEDRSLTRKAGGSSFVRIGRREKGAINKRL